MSILVRDVGIPVDDRGGVFPLVETGFLSYSGVNILKYLLANASYLALGWVNEAALGLVYEVVLVIF